MQLSTPVILYLLLINLIAFALFLSALLGGSIGSIAGMQVFRHKTKHWYFVVGMPCILIAEGLLGYFILNR